MQTVQFQCGHCGKLMGVSHEFLGQQVRCPTCQQIVLAPAGEGSELAPSADGNADELFLANLQTAPIGDPPSPETQPAAAPEPAPEATAPEAPAPEATAPASASDAIVPGPALHGVVPGDSGAHDGSLPWHDPAVRTGGAAEPVARAQRGAAAGGISWLWLLPLFSYSVLATVMLVIVYNSLQTSNATIRDQNTTIEKQRDELKELRKMRGKPDPDNGKGEPAMP